MRKTFTLRKRKKSREEKRGEKHLRKLLSTD
jgi:hypothetical protein